MKAFIQTLLLGFSVTCFTACETNELFNDEQYKKIIYLLSNDDMTFPIEHALNEEETTGYVTIYVGGSNPIEKDVTVTLEYDGQLLQEYNLLNFDLEKQKYAKELDKSKYTIDSYTITMKAGSETPYVLFPIKIRANGLSPDSAYMIPLKIKEVSGYEINPDKSRVLYHTYIKNDFAEQLTRRYLFMSGTRQIGQEAETKIAGNKIMLPLAKRKVRICAAIEYADRPTLEQINQKSIVLEVGENKVTSERGITYLPVTVSSYKSEYLQVEQVPRQEDNLEVSSQEANRYVTINGVKRFILSYRYRTIKTPATATTNAEWGEWTTVSENMKHAEK